MFTKNWRKQVWEFLAAVLGSNENKQAFIESEKGIPDLSSFKLSSEEKEKLRLKNEALVTARAKNQYNLVI